MACERFEDLLQEHLDGSLSKAEQADLQHHLSACAACRRDALLYDRMLSALGQCNDVEAPSAQITQGVMRALELDASRTGDVVLFPLRPAPRWEWALVGVAAVAMMALGTRLAERPRQIAPVMVISERLDARPVVAVTRAKAIPRKAVGRLILDGGAVSVQREGSSTWHSESGEVELALGDRIRTVDSASDAILYFRERGRLTVKPGTDLQIIDNGIRVRQGTTWIKVAKRGSVFHAETPNAVAAVRGTIYTVEVSGAFPARTDVCVFQGSVEVYPGTFGYPLAAPVVIEQDRSVQVSGHFLGQPEPVKAEVYSRFGMQVPPELREPVAVVAPLDQATVAVVPLPATGDADTSAADRVRLLDGADGEAQAPSAAVSRPTY